MARAVRSSRLAVVAVGAIALFAFHTACTPFLAAPRTSHTVPNGPVNVASTAAAAAAFAGSQPVHAEGLDFGKIPLGGGFAINLDIPETGIVNLVVLIAGLIYLLGPLLSESMATREKEISEDIADAIAKYEEATARLAEAEKSKAQAESVIAEIEASIAKDKEEFKSKLDSQTTMMLDKLESSQKSGFKLLAEATDATVEAYILEKAITQGVEELAKLPKDKKAAFMKSAIKLL